MGFKKVAIIGSLSLLNTDDLMTRAKKEVDRILNLEKAERPDFSFLIIGDDEINMGVGLGLMKEAMKLEVPILICSAEHKKEIDSMEEGKMAQILKDLNNQTEMIFKLERTRVPEMPRLERYEPLRHEKNSFGGQKRGSNHKLRRR